MNKETEHIVIERIISGEKEAFRFLIQAYQEFAFNLSFQILQSKEDAEEVTQDSFVKAYRSLSQFHQQSKFSTWFYRIVYNTSLTKLRTNKKHTGVLTDIDDDVIENISSPDIESALSKMEKEERNRLLQDALLKLKENERALISLFYLKENSVEEVAEITKMSKSNVKVKIHRIRKKLQALLVQEQIFEYSR